MKKKKKSTKSAVVSKKTKVDDAARKVLKAFADDPAAKITTGALQASFHKLEREDNPEVYRGSFPVVAVGASAGGIESYTELLRHLPARTGMAFVFIQHLAPQHESVLPSILARVAKIPVLQAETGLVVKPDHVYVIPPNVNMGIIFGVLKLMPRPDSLVKHMPVDFFLRCLADDQHHFAIGVILSGADGDGAQGLRSIRAQGGLTLVQDPHTAKNSGMPQSAIDAGATDKVLTIPEIARELEGIGRHPLIAPDADPLVDGEAWLVDIFRLLRRFSGVNFAKYKRATIARRLRRRMVLHKVNTLGEYVEIISGNHAEIEELYRDLLIGVTGFFRDAEMFETFKRLVLTKAFKTRPDETPYRFWIAGCSTGEEVYSFAICMLEVQEQLGLRVPIQIFASDINERALKKAREAIYGDSIQVDVSSDRLRRYFTKVAGGYRVNTIVRELCVFARHNVTTDPPFSRQDGISCRNLLIYFDPSFQANVIKLFAYALNPGGTLILGSSETPGHSESLDALDPKQRIYRRTEASSRSHFEVPLSLLPVTKDPARVAVTGLEGTQSSLDRQVNRVLIERYAPAGVLINDGLQILQFRGATGEFLEGSPGEASLNLFKMAKPGLDAELRLLIQKARATNQAVRNEKVPLRQGRSHSVITVEVIPLRKGDEVGYFLVMFNRTSTSRSASSTTAKARPLPRTNAIRVLERELETIKDHLQSIIRDQEYTNAELQTANEEILSGNEELQSINEELQTAKEELQSTNEELSTVNDELLNRNAELLHSTNDLTNLLASVNLPMVMVGPDMCVRRFTPAAERIFNLIEADVGRPITQIRPNVDLPELESMIQDAIVSMRTTELEVRDRSGHWYSLRIRPYRTAENKIEGAVLMLVDIGTIRITSEQLRESRGVNDTFFDTVSQPILLLDSDLNVVRVNDGFCRTFRTDKPSVIGKRLFSLSDGAWGLPMLKALIGEVVSKGQLIADFHLDQVFPRVGSRRLILNARQIQIDGSTCVLLIIDDVTDKKSPA